MSAIIPRPVDHKDTDPVVKSVNRFLKDRIDPDMVFFLYLYI